MLNRNIVSEDFRYRSNEFNFRSGFPEEATVKRQVLFTRIDYWINVYKRKLKLIENTKITFHITQTSLDVFALYLAAIECDLDIVIDNPDIVIHNLPDSVIEQLGYNKILNYNYFDLSDMRFNGTSDYKQKGTGKIYGTSQKDINIKKLNLKGIVLHTKYCVQHELFLEFMLPALSSSVECHMGLGYNNLDEGIMKIAKIIQKHGIGTVMIPNEQGIKMLQKYYNDFDSLKVFSYNDTLVTQLDNKNFDSTNNEFLKSVPKKFNVKGTVLHDLETEDLYFQFYHNINQDVARAKIKAMNGLIKSKTGKRITKWRFMSMEHDESLMFFRYV